ncbi:MAG: hypothetical protein U0326_43965 [Polyangiales bacterium]
MSTSRGDVTALARLAEIDAWRLDGDSSAADARSKEWHHFAIFGVGWTALFNLNLDGPSGARAIAVIQHEGWRARVARCKSPRVRRGHLDAVFDDAGMRWRDGRYEVWMRDRGLSLEATLTPASTPSLSHDIALGPGARLNWCLVPRLVASGRFAHGETHVRFEDRPAYHDHNWGRFAWGGDFAWEWGCGVPDDSASPWTVIFARMNDRALRRTTARSVFLLRDGRHLRYFRDAEVRFVTEGAVVARPIARAPAAAALLLPDEDRDVPSRTLIEAQRGDDRVEITVSAETRGQLLVPSEVDLRRVVRVNEAHGRVRVAGRCDGERVSFEGASLLEVVRG